MARYLDEAVESDEIKEEELNDIQKELWDLNEKDEPQHVLAFKSWKSDKVQEEEKKG